MAKLVAPEATSLLESPPSAAPLGSLAWVDRLKGLALLWIVLNHVVERMIGGAAAANPTVPWPPLAQRFAQFAPVHAGALTWPLTFVRDLAWFGDQGVTLFVILSGFGLTYGALASGGALDAGRFYRRRAFRIYPMWWGAHALFFVAGLAFVHGLSAGDWRFYASLAGVRFLPSTMYYFAPAWWYVGLILQLYLVFPLLWRFLRARGAVTLLALCCFAGYASLALGQLVIHDAYLDAWQRGAIFVTRLPEFAFGMALAAWWHADRERTMRALRSPVAFALAAAAYAAATLASFTLRGNIVAASLLGASAFVLLFPFVAFVRGERDDVLQRTGRFSYPLYLVHQPLVLALVPAPFALRGAAVGIPLALAGTFVAAFALARGTAWAERLLASLRRRRGAVATASVAVAAALGVLAIPIAGDLAVRAFAPQEANGWGERPSLEPDATFGWKLIPSQTTRLRWVSYDYRVTANALGFPGPQFADAKPRGTLRVLTTGDAYTSAEGVDTDLAWPRVLQRTLATTRKSPVEVLNFAITGYGPNEEAAVVRTFLPRFRPDVVVIELFANDVSDVLTSDDAFRDSIGFGLPAQHGIRSVLALDQLRHFLRYDVLARIAARLRHQPDADDYFLGGFRYLERGHADLDGPGVRQSARRYVEMARVARAAGARLFVALVPTPVEVCDRAALAYYPRGVDLGDGARFDRGLPTRRAREIADAARLPLWDLGPPLRALGTCPYMPRNLHLTAAGQAAVASIVAGRLGAVK